MAKLLFDFASEILSRFNGIIIESVFINGPTLILCFAFRREREKEKTSQGSCNNGW